MRKKVLSIHPHYPVEILLVHIAVMTEENAKKPTVVELLSQPNDDIVNVLGTVYEHSAWIAEQFVGQNKTSIETVTQLAAALKAIVDEATLDKKLALLCAHPDLCQKVEQLKTLTSDSQDEQARSGLQSLTADELALFTKTNTDYRERFQFPFILAVRNATKYTVLAALQGRVSNARELEMTIALQQVHKIAWMRLLTKFDLSNARGFLTCHVLDTANGCPGTFAVGGLAVRTCCASLLYCILTGSNRTQDMALQSDGFADCTWH